MMELNMYLKQTTELNEHDMNSLIALKQQYWGYSNSEQIKWIGENIMADDYHILIYGRGGVLLAYLNAVNVEANIDQSRHRMMGIGNVCVDKKHTHAGVGSILMACINVFIRQSSSCGILLCKEKLIPFYESSKWKAIYPQIITIFDQPYDHAVMLFDPFKIVTINRNAQKINLSRNF